MTEQFERPQGLEAISEEDKALLESIKKQRDTKEKVNRVIKGENDIFDKEYTFEELDLKFTIKIKLPSILEQAKIQAATERMFEGLGSLMPPNVLRAYRMLATIQICGKEIPSIFKDADDIYNISIFDIISSDFQDWMNSFRY